MSPEHEGDKEVDITAQEEETPAPNPPVSPQCVTIGAGMATGAGKALY